MNETIIPARFVAIVSRNQTAIWESVHCFSQTVNGFWNLIILSRLNMVGFCLTQMPSVYVTDAMLGRGAENGGV